MTLVTPINGGNYPFSSYCGDRLPCGRCKHTMQMCPDGYSIPYAAGHDTVPIPDVTTTTTGTTEDKNE